MFLYAVTSDYCKAHIAITASLCLPMRVRSNLIVSLFNLWWESSRDFYTWWLYTEYFLCVWHDSFELLSVGLMNHVDISQLERLWRVNSLDVNNRSCCVLRDVCECWQACSCRAACIVSVLPECFSEYYNLSVEICSCLTLYLLDHDCLYQAGLLTICYAVVWQEQSSWILCNLVFLLVWVL